MDWLGSKKNAQISTGSDFVLASIPTQAPAHGAQQAQVSSHLASQGLPEGLHFGWFWQKLQFVSTFLLKLHIYICVFIHVYTDIYFCIRIIGQNERATERRVAGGTKTSADCSKQIPNLLAAVASGFPMAKHCLVYNCNGIL